MVFLCLHKVGRLDFRGEIQLKSHGFSRHPGVEAAFLFQKKGGHGNAEDEGKDRRGERDCK
jgi:hypothetical protein